LSQRKIHYKKQVQQSLLAFFTSKNNKNSVKKASLIVKFTIKIAHGGSASPAVAVLTQRTSPACIVPLSQQSLPPSLKLLEKKVHFING
jgi:hypothetical protein